MMLFFWLGEPSWCFCFLLRSFEVIKTVLILELVMCSITNLQFCVVLMHIDFPVQVSLDSCVRQKGVSHAHDVLAHPVSICTLTLTHAHTHTYTHTHTHTQSYKLLMNSSLEHPTCLKQQKESLYLTYIYINDFNCYYISHTQKLWRHKCSTYLSCFGHFRENNLN